MPKTFSLVTKFTITPTEPSYHLIHQKAEYELRFGY